MDDKTFIKKYNRVHQACQECTACEYGGPCTTERNNDILDVISEYDKRLWAKTAEVEKLKKEMQPLGIKGERDKALMNLYKHYNRLTALEDIDYTTLESMHILIDSIEKLEHARHMEASDEIAKMAFEKLEKFARPLPEIKMDVKQFEEIAKDHYGKKGAKE